MINQYLNCLLESRHRRLIVIIGTFVTGLVTLLPLADEYRGLVARRTELELELQTATNQSSQLPKIEQQVQQRGKTLAAWEARMVPHDRVQQFRGRVVALVRESGCQIRRIHTGEVHSRAWAERDNPLNRVTLKKGAKQTPYLLESQPFSLSITGTYRQVTALLAELHREGKLLHTQTLALRTAGRNVERIDLELELVLFDLTYKKKQTAA